jgi:hypothetical protein
MSPEARRELEAIDAALQGDSVGKEHADLATLALTLRELRQQPAPLGAFAHTMDARVTEGFRRRPTGPLAAAQWSHDPPRDRVQNRPRRPLRGIVTHKAFGLGIAAVVALAVVVPLALTVRVSGGGSNSTSARAGITERTPASVSAPTTSVQHAEASPDFAEAGHGEAGTAGEKGAAGVPRAPGVPEARVKAGPEAAVQGGVASAPQAAPARQVEHGASLDIGVAPTAIQNASQRVFALANVYHGYVQESNVSSGNSEQAGAAFQVKLPSTSLAAAIAAFIQIGHVRSENQTSNDVTEQYGSLQRSLGDARAERSSLLKQLAAATAEQQAATLKARLSAVERKLAGLERSLGALDKRVNYTTVALSLTPEAQGVAAGSLTPGGAVGDAGEILATAVAILLLALTAAVPLAVVVAVGWLAVTRTRRRLREQALDVS